jgi:predicted phage terminase large subunit-like protein
MYYPRPFDLDKYLGKFDPRLLGDPEGRRIATRLDPLLFGLTYLPHHLRGKETGDRVSFSEMHLDLYEIARSWVAQEPEPMAGRHAIIAPRGAAKSTMCYLILPLWAAAHGFQPFIAAFADSTSQAERHLGSFKAELETNQLLRGDFPALCTPRRRPSGTVASDNRSMYLAESGFTFVAKGIDSSALGLKVGNQRPTLIITDDIEPDAANYSMYQKEQRLSTLLEAVFPMSIHARVMMVGTTSMPGAIMHDLVKKAWGEETEPWVDDEKIQCHYYPAIIQDAVTGAERSLWPEKWSMETLGTIRHTRQFRSQYMNSPLAYDGSFWTDDDFTYRDDVLLSSQVLSIDPAVTSKEKSDYTALAVVGYSRVQDVAVVRAVWNLKIPPGTQLRDRVLAILDLYPETMGVIVETNQGGDAWKAILNDLPVRLRTVHQSAAKELRAERLLNHYQYHRVVHERRLPALEEQMVAFPRGAHDDLLDAVGTAVEALRPAPKRRGVVRTATYV